MPKKWLVVGLFGHLDCFLINKKMLIFDLVSSNLTLNRVGCRFFSKSCKCRFSFGSFNHMLFDHKILNNIFCFIIIS